MSISESFYLMFGAPLNKDLSDDADRLEKVLNGEGLQLEFYGNSWTDDIRFFLRIKPLIKEIGSDEDYEFNLTELNLNKNINSTYLPNLKERLKEFGVSEDKIGWYFIRVVA